MFFEQGLGGLSAAEQKLNIIGKNIANGNTNGYKTSSIDFTNVLANTLNSPNTGASITAASGPLTGNITQSFTQGPISGTGNPLDIAINGKGFFQLQDPVTGKLSYTRDGAFQLNGKNQIENAVGMLLTGYTAGVQGGTAAPIDLSKYQRSTGALSATVTPTTNLSLSSAVPQTSFDPVLPTSYNYSTSTTGLDNIGRSYTLQMFYAKDNSSSSSTSVYNVYTSYVTPATKLNTVKVGQVFFDSTGVVSKVMANSPATLITGTNSFANIPIGEAPGLSKADQDSISANIDGFGLTNSSGTTKKDYTGDTPWMAAKSSNPVAAATSALSAIKASTTLSTTQVKSFETYINDVATQQTQKITPVKVSPIDINNIKDNLAKLTTINTILSSLSTTNSVALTSALTNAITSATDSVDRTAAQNRAAAVSQVITSSSVLTPRQKTDLGGALSLVGNEMDDFGAALYEAVISPTSPTALQSVADLAITASTTKYGDLVLTSAQKDNLKGIVATNISQGTTALEDALGKVNLTWDTPYTNDMGIKAVADAATSFVIGNAQSVNLNLDNLTQSGQTSQTTAMTNTSTTVGILESFSIEKDGQIIGSYSNSQTQSLGSIALANFTSTAGLRPFGNNSWEATIKSGQPILGSPASGGLGSLQSSALEGSNEDQTSDMVALLAAQRAYQANAQTVKAQDQMAQALLNL